MNRLSVRQRAKVVACLVEGNSVRSTCRLTGVAKGTVLKLLVDLGDACQVYHDEHVRDLDSTRIQADEIWTYCGAKRSTVLKRKLTGEVGDIWTWTALDPDSKLMVAYLLGERDYTSAIEFISDLHSRLKHKIQLTTDTNWSYLKPVSEVFGEDINFGMLHKQYKNRRYVGSEKRIVTGNPDPDKISTSLVERQNLNMRMGMRRFTRHTNAFSKKLRNLSAAVALHFMHYNFVRVHQTLRMTPAMKAGIAGHPWTLEELVGLLDKRSILHGLKQTA